MSSVSLPGLGEPPPVHPIGQAAAASRELGTLLARPSRMPPPLPHRRPPALRKRVKQGFSSQAELELAVVLPPPAPRPLFVALLQHALLVPQAPCLWPVVLRWPARVPNPAPRLLGLQLLSPPGSSRRAEPERGVSAARAVEPRFLAWFAGSRSSSRSTTWGERGFLPLERALPLVTECLEELPARSRTSRRLVGWVRPPTCPRPSGRGPSPLSSSRSRPHVRNR